MKIGNKEYKTVNNVTEYICPVCGKKLVHKPPCCSEKIPWYSCVCGYKRRADV